MFLNVKGLYYQNISVVQFLISKGTFSWGSNFSCFFTEPSGLVMRLILWVSKTFGFDHFHKDLKVGTILDKVQFHLHYTQLNKK
jgi:hypothetical protein